MKNVTTILAFLVLPVLLLGTPKKEPFQINGQVKNRQGGTVRLFQFNESLYDSRTSKVVDGKFRFLGNLDYPEHYAIEYIEPGAQFGKTFQSFKFFLEPETKVNIEIYPDSISKSKITGSNLVNEFAQINHIVDMNLNPAFTKLRLEFDEALKANKNEQKKIIMAKVDSVQKELLKWQLNYISQIPNSYISAYLLSEMTHYIDRDTVNKYFKVLDPSLDGSKYTILISNYLSTLIGKPFQDFELYDSNKKLYKLSDIAKGKVVLIDFWASWCKACRLQNAKLASIYEKYKSKGFEIVGVSSDRDYATFLKTIKADKMNWINLIDGTGIKSVEQMIYSPSRLPSNVLIDKNGIITHKDIETAELEKTLDTILSK